MEVMVIHCCGLDVHQKSITACVLVGKLTSSRPKKTQKTFGTTTFDLRSLSEWLKELEVSHVLMESTGQYWKPVWNILEPEDFHLILANPQHIKNVPGRKTDMKDAEWIALLGRCGLVNASYVPDKETQELRYLTRQRSSVKQEKTKRVNEIHNILQRANIKLTSYLSNIFGKTGKALLTLFINGEKITEEVVAREIHGKVKASIAELVRAMDGCLSKCDRALLNLHLQTILRLEEEISELNQLIDEYTEKFSDVYLRLIEIPGISKLTAEVILAEIGCTVNAFQTAENLASWAGLCPGNYESAGIKKRSNATKGNKYLKVALCRAGISAGRSKSGTIHSFFVKLSQRMPKAKAAVATAHKLLRIVYVLLKTGQRYDELIINKEKGSISTGMA